MRGFTNLRTAADQARHAFQGDAHKCKAACGYAASKKADLAKTCETIFAGKAIIEQEVKEAALAWLPEAMKFSAAMPEGAQSADPDASEDGKADIDAIEGVDALSDAEEEPEGAAEDSAVAA